MFNNCLKFSRCFIIFFFYLKEKVSNSSILTLTSLNTHFSMIFLLGLRLFSVYYLDCMRRF